VTIIPSRTLAKRLHLAEGHRLKLGSGLDRFAYLPVLPTMPPKTIPCQNGTGEDGFNIPGLPRDQLSKPQNGYHLPFAFSPIPARRSFI
jgi:hypothetical protein